jgi:hypothetical protein
MLHGEHASIKDEESHHKCYLTCQLLAESSVQVQTSRRVSRHRLELSRILCFLQGCSRLAPVSEDDRSKVVQIRRSQVPDANPSSSETEEPVCFSTFPIAPIMCPEPAELFLWILFLASLLCREVWTVSSGRNWTHRGESNPQFPNKYFNSFNE